MPGPRQPALTPAIASKSRPVTPLVSTKSPLAPSSAAPAAISAAAAATSAIAAATSAGPPQPGAQQADSVSSTAEKEEDEDLSMPVSDKLCCVPICAGVYVVAAHDRIACSEFFVQPCHGCCVILCNTVWKRQVAFRLLSAHAVHLSTVRLLLGAKAPLHIVDSYSHQTYYLHCRKQLPSFACLHTFLPSSVQPAFDIFSNS